jgi:hypothetical protein
MMKTADGRLTDRLVKLITPGQAICVKVFKPTSIQLDQISLEIMGIMRKTRSNLNWKIIETQLVL